jgi:ribosomal protein S18 acetylase RimI-like enzyme
MNLAYSMARVVAYWKRHGVSATAHRAVQALSRSMFSRRMLLFYVDIGSELSGSSDLPASVCVERKNTEAEIDPLDLRVFLSFWNPKIAAREMRGRFVQGASLWMIKRDGKLAGYGWTLRGRTVEPHFLSLAPDDVHLFDYYVAPSFRGRGLNPHLVNHILASLAAEGRGRAFIEVAEWNEPQLASLRKTPFRLLGCAWKCTIGNRTIVGWNPGHAWKFQGLQMTNNRVTTVNSREVSDRSNLPA